MRGLMQFLSFDSARFFSGKRLKVITSGQLVDHETKQVIGSKIALAIVEDKTEYHSKSGEQISNLFEKVTVKVPNKSLELALGTEVELIAPKCVVYGEYRNQLSITADDIKVVGVVKG